MDGVTLPEWVDQIKRAWLIIGSLLVALGFNLPDIVPVDLFTQGFINIVMELVGAVLVFVQFFRKDADGDEGAARSLSVPNKTAFALNPFKLRLRRPA